MTESKTFHDDDLHVQTLKPPYFEPTGIVVPRKEAWEKGLWYPTVNLWVVNPATRSIYYQQRSLNIGWAPGKFDVLIAGHCEHLQTPLETVAIEASEEMGVKYDPSTIKFIGKKLSVGVGQDGTIRNSVINLFLVEDSRPVNSFLQQPKEVFAVAAFPIEELKKVHSNQSYKFSVETFRNNGDSVLVEIDNQSFPPNWDPYHQKMALLVEKYFKGDQSLIY